MLRRILIILVLLGFVFIIYRFINPIGANNFLDNVRNIPSNIFNKDKNSDVIEVENEGTTLHINSDEEDVVNEDNSVQVDVVVTNEEVDDENIDSDNLFDENFLDDLLDDDSDLEDEDEDEDTNEDENGGKDNFDDVVEEEIVEEDSSLEKIDEPEVKPEIVEEEENLDEPTVIPEVKPINPKPQPQPVGPNNNDISDTENILNNLIGN